MNWISVKDKLPPIYIMVLVYTASWRTCFASLNEDGSWDDDHDEKAFDDVTHWMHIPTAPKE